MNEQFGKMEIRVVGFVLGALLILLCVLMARNTIAIRESNEVREDGQTTQLRAEYERVLLGCITPEAEESNDARVRTLCDETLLFLQNNATN